MYFFVVQCDETKMPKLNLKNHVGKILLALLLVAVFGGAYREVQAAENTEGSYEGSYLDAGYKDKDFEVTLQTPFAKPPSKIPCIESESDVYTEDEHGNQWVCKANSTVWQQVISGDDGSEILTLDAGMIYKWLAGFIELLAVLFIVVGGIQISTAGANQEGVQAAKDRIIAALVALTLLFLASLILYTINPNFFKNADQSAEVPPTEASSS